MSECQCVGCRARDGVQDLIDKLFDEDPKASPSKSVMGALHGIAMVAARHVIDGHEDQLRDSLSRNLAEFFDSAVAEQIAAEASEVVKQ